MALSLFLIAPVAIAQEEPTAPPELSAPEGTPGPTAQTPETPPTAPQTEPFPDAPPASDEAPDTQAPGTPAPDTGTPPTSPAEEIPSPLPSGPADADGEAPGDAVEPTVPAELPPGPLRDETLPHDLTPLGMFMMADWVVKAVMIGLVIASVATWIIAIAKGLEILFAKGRAKAGVRRLERAASLNEAINGRRRWRGPVAALAVAAADEAQRSASLSSEGIKERTAIALSRIEARAGRRMSRGTSILATVGSVSPFVGLFGTVWGIMNSFIAISESNTTNLAVVAPGIAEALLATGIGLVAAIPAVVIYNAFSRSIAGYRALLSDGSALVMRHLSRDLDRGAQEPRDYAAAE